MLANRAIVAQGLHRRGTGVRDPIHQANAGARPLSRGFTGTLPGWCGGDRGRRAMTSAAALSSSCRAVTVPLEPWVLTSVSRDSFHASHLSCSKNCFYLELRYGIEP